MPNGSLASIEGPWGGRRGPWGGRRGPWGGRRAPEKVGGALGRSFWFLSVHLRALFLLVGTAVLVARCDCTARLEW